MILETRDAFWRGAAVRQRLVGALAVAILLSIIAIAKVSSDSHVFGVAVNPAPGVMPPMNSTDTVAPVVAVTDGLEDFLGPIQEYEDGFTIVIPTFNRTADLPDLFAAYGSGFIPSLKRVVILWNNPEPFPPAVRASLTHYPVEIAVEERHINSKNLRFKVSDNMRTAAILALDDDIVFDPAEVEFGYQAWRQFGEGRRRMVGYIAREAAANGTYLLPGPHTTYSMVLTKCAFIHLDWMKAWWKEGDEDMRDIRVYVDSRKLPELYPTLNTNCEDIAMSFVYAHHSRLPPLLIKAPYKDSGLTVGISVKPGHLDARTECVRHFKQVMGNDTLISTSMFIDRMRGPVDPLE